VEVHGGGNAESDRRPTRGYIEQGRWEIEIALERHSARASLQPLYDPPGERVRSCPPPGGHSFRIGEIRSDI
jgi:hypothetical protein